MKRPPMRRMQEVARLYRARWTVAGIAAKLGVSKYTVRAYAKEARKAGLDVPRGVATGGQPRRLDYAAVLRMWEAGHRQRAIADAFGVHPTSIGKALRGMARDGIVSRPLGRWPQRDAATAERMR